MMDLSICGYLVLFIGIMFIVVTTLHISSSSQSQKEGFIQSNSFVVKEGPNVYDDFYANIYDHLVYNTAKNDYEIGAIINTTKPTRNSKILDVGCGTGHHVASLRSKGYSVVGIDESSAMIKKCKENHPDCDFQKKNALNTYAFQQNTFTHIMCMYFTIYSMQDKSMFFKNAFLWLKPGGYCIVHLVERERFDPILPPGNPILFTSIQKHAKKRIMSTKIKFSDFSYASVFKTPPSTDDEKYIFEEKFKNDSDGKTRKNEHLLYMSPIHKILKMAETQGFLPKGKIDLSKCQYDYQYMYIFMKPREN